ncbi:hypothetical protein ACN6LL_002211 [Streptomyces violaceoruber]
MSNLATALVDMAQRQPQGLAMQDEKTVLTYADLDDLVPVPQADYAPTGCAPATGSR